jgi:hypothetical protein
MKPWQSRLGALSLVELMDAWALTDYQDGPDVPTVRGWIMDELERRNPAAFARWIDEDGPLERYFTTDTMRTTA